MLWCVYPPAHETSHAATVRPPVQHSTAGPHQLPLSLLLQAAAAACSAACSGSRRAAWVGGSVEGRPPERRNLYFDVVVITERTQMGGALTARCTFTKPLLS